MVWTYLSDFDW